MLDPLLYVSFKWGEEIVNNTVNNYFVDIYTLFHYRKGGEDAAYIWEEFLKP